MLIRLLLTATLAAALPATAKTLDLRNMTDADGTLREISFCARPSPDKPGLPGHAFVAFAEIKKDQSIRFRAVGHTVFSVGDALLSYEGLIPASGAIVAERYTSAKQQCLTVQVNSPSYAKAYGAALQPLKAIGVTFDETLPVQKSYSLASEDCVAFLMSVANQFTSSGLKVPKRNANELPLNYVRRLIDSN